jgi:parvulin-like peptidyl-prolyl isomerase
LAGGVAVLVSLILGSARAPAQEIIDRVLAVAAGDVIMLSDVAAARDFGLVTPAPGGDPIKDVLSRLIERALVMAEVQRYAPPEPDAPAVDRALDAVRARFATREAFDRALERVGMSEAHVRELLRGDLRIQAYLEQRFTVAAPNEDELARYYQDRPELFVRDGRRPPLAEIRQQVLRAAVADRRRALVADWIADLRRRADVVDLYSIQRP